MGKLIFGGSFNPVHIGHLRLAVEAGEMLAGFAREVEFVPCAEPPHKDRGGLLPFALRAAMLRAALENLPGMSCNELEARRPGPSYTHDTLLELKREYDGELYFLIGSQDYALLPQWWKWLELPRLCSLVVAPRGDFSIGDFEAQSRKLWPGSRMREPRESQVVNGASVDLPCGGSVHYLPVPHLDISASRIRELWLAGRNVDYLVPRPSLKLLNEEKQAALACWLEKR